MTNDMVFELLRASLFSSNEDFHLSDWKPVFEEMKVQVSRDAKNENSVSQGENGVLTRIQKSSGYSPEA